MRRFFLTALLILLCLVSPVSASAGSEPAQHVTVLLLVDNSGSMKTSDPQGLRFTGARLFSALLDLGDSLGVVVFSTQAQALTDQLLTLSSQADKQVLLKTLEQAQPAQGFTDVKAALQQAQIMLGDAARADEKIVIVLLTDGKPEISNPYPHYEQETLDLARSLEAPILAIALTADAQTPFLDRLAGGTGGRVLPAQDAADLMQVYLQVLEEIKDRIVIGGQHFQDGASLDIDPSLAPYLQSVIFVAARSGTAVIHLSGPDGREIDSQTPQVSFMESGDARFALVALENPPGGSYSFRLAGGGEGQAWAILRSRLRVKVEAPAPFSPLGREMPIVVSLWEELPSGQFIKILGQADFTALIFRPDGRQESLDRFYDDGTHGDLVAGDGNHSRMYPNANRAGVYRISIRGWKGAVPVQAETSVSVSRFPTFVVDSPQPGSELHAAVVGLTLHLEPGAGAFLDQGQVVAKITDSSGETQEIPLAPFAEGYTGTYQPVRGGAILVHVETHQAKYLGVEYQTALDFEFDLKLVRFMQVNLETFEFPTACLGRQQGGEITLAVTSYSREVLRFLAPPGWKVSPASMEVGLGSHSVLLRLEPVETAGGRPPSPSLRLEGGEDLVIQPAAAIDVPVRDSSWVVRCQAPIRWSGGLLCLAFAGAVVYRQVRSARRPLQVSGTLRYGPHSVDAAQPMEVDLTALQKRILLIGSGEACDLRIDASGLEPEHARLRAEKHTDGPTIILEPLGAVQKGYARQTARFALRHGETFRMGAYEFQYLSDSGD